jgi:hypothetical protein
LFSLLGFRFGMVPENRRVMYHWEIWKISLESLRANKTKAF